MPQGATLPLSPTIAQSSCTIVRDSVGLSKIAQAGFQSTSEHMDLRSLDGVEVVIEEEQGKGGKEEAIRGQHVPQIVRIKELERNAPCIAVARLCKANQPIS